MAEAIDKFCRTQEVMDVSRLAASGVLSADDMARWQPTVEAPLTYDYGRYTVCKAGVWSQGPVMLQQLALLKGFELDGLDPTGPEFIHLQIECAKLAFADREKFYGDPEVRRRSRSQTLLSDAYNDERRKLISGQGLARFQRPGSVEGFGARGQAAPRRRPSRGGRRDGRGRADGRPLRRGARRHRAFRHHRPGRQHDLGDAVGRLAAILAGHSRARLLPRQPRARCSGWRKTIPAALAPGKRPRTTLSPTMALRDGEPYMAWGSPGGDQQDQWITQFFLRHVHAGMNLQEAIDAPAWHSEHFPISFWPRTARPGVLVLEKPRAEGDGRRTAASAATWSRSDADWSEGRLTAASRGRPAPPAAANPRGMQGYAAGR